MKELNYQIGDMNCKHCQNRIEKALKEIKGIKKIKINQDNKTLTLSAKETIQNKQIEDAIIEAGYTPVEIK